MFVRTVRTLGEINNEKSMKKKVKILFVPDTIWGVSSGHRSAQKVVKIFSELSYKIGIFAPDSEDSELKHELINYDYDFFNRTPFRYYNIVINSKKKQEFEDVIHDFQPGFVLFFGTSGFNILAEVCLENKIKYFMQFLTTDYYCTKNFAGLENGPCFKCIKGNYYHSFKNKCYLKKPILVNIIKEVAIRKTNRELILSADKILGYSKDQINDYEKFGVPKDKLAVTPIFFDRKHLTEVSSTLGDYFLLSGQFSVAKGWHKLWEIIEKCPDIKFKLLFSSMNVALESLDKYNLTKYYNSGQISVETNIEKHSDLLNIVSNARGVIIPSYYPTTGEFFLLETLGLGKVALTFDSGVHKEIISHGVNGMIAEVNDVKKFSDNIKLINSDDVLCNKISLEAKNLFEYLISDNRFKTSLVEIFAID